MLTHEYLKSKGITYERFKFRWMPEKYKLTTSEFSEDGSFIPLEFLPYLMLWENRLNKTCTSIDMRDEEGHVIGLSRNKEYFVIRRKFNKNWYCTLVKIEGGLNEAQNTNV